MDTRIIVAIYLPLALISVAIFLLNLFKRNKGTEQYLTTLLCFCAVCWYGSSILEKLSNDAAVVEFFNFFPLVFVGFVPPVLLLFVLKFYRVPLPWTAMRLGALFLVPVINMAMVSTARFHDWLQTNFTIVSLFPIREISFDWGPWFWVHTGYCYIITMLLLSVILYKHFRIAKFYRVPSRMMVFSISITMIGNGAALMRLFPTGIDPTLFVMSFSLILLDLASSNNSNKFVRYSRGQLFHYLNEYILVLDESQRIVDYNRSALELFSARKISLASAHFHDIMEGLLRYEKNTQKVLEDDNDYDNKNKNESESDIYLYDDFFPLVLNLRIKKLKDFRDDEIGSIAVFSDVTKNRMLLERLEARVGIDSLTGLANHMAYQGAKKRLDNPQWYPLSVIMCDVNDLKYVNDYYGHHYGDMLLQMIADNLHGVCPKGCFVARIGGDEFIFLLPTTSPGEANKIMADINGAIDGCKIDIFTVTVSLGAATKLTEREDLDDVITLADRRMYENKKLMKNS